MLPVMTAIVRIPDNAALIYGLSKSLRVVDEYSLMDCVPNAVTTPPQRNPLSLMRGFSGTQGAVKDTFPACIAREWCSKLDP